MSKRRRTCSSTSAQPVEKIRMKADEFRELRRRLHLEASPIRLAMTEWNYWYGPQVFGEIGPRYFLKDALGIACGLHEFFRQSDVYFMANYAQAVNVIGAVKASKTAARMETTGLAWPVSRRHFGRIPVKLTGQLEPLDAAEPWPTTAACSPWAWSTRPPSSRRSGWN